MTIVKANCWQQPTTDQPSPWGHDAKLAPDLKLDAEGKGSFVFHAEQFPNGPINLRIYAKDSGTHQDYCELQLYNKGGVVWNQGASKTDPPAAKGMKLVFCDDFDGPLSIARDNSGKYWTHWGGGDGSEWGFGENAGPHNPFSQVGTFLRIHASKPAGTRARPAASPPFILTTPVLPPKRPAISSAGSSPRTQRALGRLSGQPRKEAPAATRWTRLRRTAPTPSPAASGPRITPQPIFGANQLRRGSKTN